MNTDLRGIYEGPLAKKVVVYTVPIILTGVLQLLFNAADLVVVGWFGGGSSSVGAVGATGSIINLITNLFIGLSIGAGRWRRASARAATQTSAAPFIRPCRLRSSAAPL